jgi:death on curing protein
VIYLTLPELLHIAGRVLNGDPPVRDIGLLEAAVARPQATALGADAYPDTDSKAATLLHSLARNHALIDGSKRLALAAVIAFYGVNGRRLTLTSDSAYDLVSDVATGLLDSVEEIAERLRSGTEPRSRHDLCARSAAEERVRAWVLCELPGCASASALRVVRCR